MYSFDVGNMIKKLAGAVEFTLPSGVKCSIDSTKKNPYLDLTFEKKAENGSSAEFALTAKNVSNETLYVDSLIPAFVSSELGGDPGIGEGINCWTQLAGGLGKGVLDLCDPCHNDNMLDFYAVNYAMYGRRAVNRYAFFGFTSFLKQNSSLELHCVRENFSFKSIIARCKAGGIALAPGETISSETILVCTGDDPDKIMRDYFSLLASRNTEEKREFKDVVGWATWDCYQNKITEDQIMENVEWLAAHRDTVPVEYIQLDAGFEICDGDWLVTNKKFPHGLKWLADKIHEKGFKAGLWLCPFLMAKQSKVCTEHPDWALKDATGAPLPVMGYAVSSVYALDCSIPGALKYLEDLAKTLTYDFGFDYLKLDGANGQVLSPLAHTADPSMTTGEAVRKGLQAFSRGLKKGTFLLNASMFGISIGLVDGMRIGEDVGGRWDMLKIAKHHGERDRFNGAGEVLRAIAASANHYQMHKLLWINDPDYLVVRQAGCNSELSYKEARSWAGAVNMCNGLTMISDPMKELLPERIELLEKVLPHSPKAARPVDFFRKNVPSIYAMEAWNETDKWLVTDVINTDVPNRVREYVLDFADVGIKKDTDYFVFNFWDAKFEGTFRNEFKVTLEPHDSAVFRFTEKTGKVQVIGTDSHISMGALEIASVKNNGKEIVIKTKKRGKAGKIFFFVPDGAGTSPALQKTQDKNVFYCDAAFDGGTIELKFS